MNRDVFKTVAAEETADRRKKPPYDKETIIRRMKLFYEHALETTGKGRWPCGNDKIVWDKNDKGKWVQIPNESWSNLSVCLSMKLPCVRNLEAKSLVDFRVKNGLGVRRVLVTPIDVETMIRWHQMFAQHEAETTGVPRWPSTRDKHVWDKDTNGKWFTVSGESWNVLNASMYKRSPKLNLLGARSLVEFREIHKEALGPLRHNRDHSNNAPAQRHGD